MPESTNMRFQINQLWYIIKPLIKKVLQPDEWLKGNYIVQMCCLRRARHVYRILDIAFTFDLTTPSTMVPKETVIRPYTILTDFVLFLICNTRYSNTSVKMQIRDSLLNLMEYPLSSVPASYIQLLVIQPSLLQHKWQSMLGRLNLCSSAGHDTTLSHTCLCWRGKYDNPQAKYPLVKKMCQNI